MNSLLKSTPLIRIILPFAIGIALEAEFNWEFDLFLLGFISVSLFLWLLGSQFQKLKKLRFRYWSGAIIMGLSFSLGILYTSVRFEQKRKSHFQNNSIVSYSVLEICKPIQEKTNTYKTIAQVIQRGSKEEWKTSSGKVLVYFKKDSISETMKIGDQFLVHVSPQKLEKPKNPHEFNYKKYLDNHQIHHQLYLKTGSWKLITAPAKFNIIRIAETARNRLLIKLKEIGIEGAEYSVISALVFGNKDALDKDLFRSYSSAGAMHVLAVSGLHVGLVYLIFNSLLFFLNYSKKSKIIKAVLLILLLWSYALLTGMSASVFRAVTMFSFIILGKILFRHSSIYNTILASAGVLLLVNPFIINEVGFQLSYLAVIGIIYLQPKIYNLFFFNSFILDKIWGLTAVSLAAQIATFPLGLLYFHQFPTYFLVSNLFVIPLATLILYITFLFMVFSWFEPLAYFFGNMVSLITKLLNFTVNKMQLLPYNQIEGVVISIAQVYLIYLGIILLSKWFVDKQKLVLWGFLSTAICLLFIWTDQENKYLNQEEILFYSISGESAISITQNDTCHFISSAKLYNNFDKMTFHVENHMNNLGNPHIVFHEIDSLKNYSGKFISIKNQFIKAFDKTIYIQRDFSYKNDSLTTEIDYLVLRKNEKKNLERLIDIIKPNNLIIDGSNYRNRSSTIAQNYSYKIIDLNKGCLLINSD